MKPIDITDQNFDSEVLQSKVPVVVDFWAEWCVPCKIIQPILEELSESYGGKIKFTKINVDQNPQKAMQYQILSIPNLKIFKNGNVADEIVGAAPRDIIASVLQKVIS